ncbi:hypothetical protein ACFFMM_19690 [Micromonospora chaiyaphumensis]|uniref:Uncharacterized protein n=1 Tax=Micromonospora chaiyaphumensis TaxID=307119 RepID=A0A1C4ZH97_9ACTN|nr:hypothetical protein [Micromonospora chaiyaphumensis]SCF32372.1 hypothetical protein GA0070214_114158 [Micromonospora chaiyaphumensis]
MTDLDQRISDVLREHAEGETDVHRLLRESRARGRRRQLRRRATTGTALALVGVLGFVGVTGTDLAGLAGRGPWTAASPAGAAPVPPRADGVPGAAQRPALVGTDPQVLHFSVDPAKGRYLGWGVQGRQVELVRFDAGGGRAVTVEVSGSAAFARNGIEGWQVTAPPPATFDGSVQRVALGSGSYGYVTWWRPAAGLYARASMRGGSVAALTGALAAVRWDEPRRCAAPLRLTSLPAGASIGSCSVDVTAFPSSLTVQLTVSREPATMWVQLLYGAQISGGRAESNRTVGGRPAYLYPAGTKLELLGIPKAHVTADLGPAWTDGYLKDKPTFTEADMATVLAGAQVAKELTDPKTWK